MAIEQAVPETGEATDATGMLRFYELAKRQEWQVSDLPWNELPPIPERVAGTPERQARRRDVWRSVVTQQLQADLLAVGMAAQLLNTAPDPEARLYYSTMEQDEARHTEAWLKLIGMIGGETERNPHLEELGHVFLEADTLEAKVLIMQGFYERFIIPRFRLISKASQGTILQDLCDRLAIDDGIHHGSGVAYERYLLRSVTPTVKEDIVKTAERGIPIFEKHVKWRPAARLAIGEAMRARDEMTLRSEVDRGLRLAYDLGIDLRHIKVGQMTDDAD